MATSDIGKGSYLNVRNKDTGEIEKKTLIPPAPSDGDLGGISEEELVQITKNKEKISSLNAELTGGLAISEWTWKLVHGSPKLSERAILKVGVIDVTLAVRVHLELAKTLGTVLSGVGRVAARCA